MCIGLHTLPPCLLFCGNYILHESEYDVHIFCVALDIIIYPIPTVTALNSFRIVKAGLSEYCTASRKTSTAVPPPLFRWEARTWCGARDYCSFAMVVGDGSIRCNGRSEQGKGVGGFRGIVRKISLMVRIGSNPHRHGSE